MPPDANLNDDQFLVKVDHVFSTRNHLSGRYFWDRYQFQRDTGSVPGIFASNLFNNQSALARDTYVLKPSTVITSSVSYSRNFRIQSVAAPVTLQELGAQVPLANNLARKEMRVNINGYVNLFGGGPLELDPETYEGHVEVSHTRGRHLLQFGGGIERNHEYALDVSTGSGNWAFNGQRTSSTVHRPLRQRASPISCSACPTVHPARLHAAGHRRDEVQPLVPGRLENQSALHPERRPALGTLAAGERCPRPDPRLAARSSFHHRSQRPYRTGVLRRPRHPECGFSKRISGAGLRASGSPGILTATAKPSSAALSASSTVYRR